MQLETTNRPLRFDICEAEPLPYLNRIQCYGILIGIRIHDLKILFISGNAEGLFGAKVKSILGEFFHKTHLYDPLVKNLLAIECQKEDFFENFFKGQNGLTYDVLAHRIEEDLLILECFEHLPPPPIPEIYWPTLFKMSEKEVHDCLFSHLEQLVEFSRAIIYRFEADGSGIVAAERRSSQLSESQVSYLGLRYPATDIPQVARNLYYTNPIRYIADIYEPEVPVFEQDHERPGKPLDLTQVLIRGVSLYHVNYMKNMGTPSSVSAAIIVKNQLWGLLSLHQEKPKKIHFKTLKAISLLAKTYAEYQRTQLVSFQMHFFDEEKVYLEQWARHLKTKSQRQDFFGSNPLAKYFQSDGFAFFDTQKWQCEGRSPDSKILDELVQALKGKDTWGVMQTDCLYAACPHIATKIPDFAGLTIAWCKKRGSEHYYFFLWFKIEIIETVTWGSSTKFPFLQDFSHASPLTSFGQWREKLSLHSSPWSKESLFIAKKILKIFMSSPEENDKSN